jgi:hypothetical protein
MIAGIIWKVEALPTPVAKNSAMNRRRSPRTRPAEVLGAQEVDHAQHAAIMPTNTQKVTRAPPQRSAPSRSRRGSAPTSGPEEDVLQHVDVGEGDLGQQRKPAE